MVCCAIAIVAILRIAIGINVYMNHKNAQHYTVTFMVDNKVYYQAQTPLNQTTQFPTNPTKEEYAFIGWYNEENVSVFYNIKLSIFFLFFLNRLWYDTNREEKT